MPARAPLSSSFRSRYLLALAAVLGSLVAPATAAAVIDEPLPHITGTEAACDRQLVGIGAGVRCTVTVRDFTNPAIAITPEGRIDLKTDRGGTFSGPCQLSAVSKGVARCTFDFLPNVLGKHQITVSFPGTAGSETRAALEPSEETFELTAVNRDPTTTAVSCVPNVLTPGKSATCRATVTDTAAFPQGSALIAVQFSTDGQGTFSPTSCLVAFNAEGEGPETVSCQVTYTMPQASSPPHSIVASFVGDFAHQPSQGSTLIREPAATSTALTCDPARVAVNAGSLCTVVVKDTSAAPTSPTGSVSLATNSAGNFSVPQCTLVPILGPGIASSTCQANYTPTAVGSGTHELKATYGGGDAHLGSLNTFGLEVIAATPNENATSTTLTCQPNPVESGDPTTCTATVKDIAAAATKAAPTGKVAFDSDGLGLFSAPECTLAATGADRAACQVSYTPAGPEEIHLLEATYKPDDADHLESVGNFELEVLGDGGGGGDQRTTSTTLTCQPNPVESGDPTTCLATVRDIAAGTKAAPTGKIAFSASGAGAFAPAECSLAPSGADRASCQVTYTPTGPAAVQELEATYDPDDGDHAGSSDTFDLQVLADGGGGDNRNTTSTALRCAPATVILGGGSVCTATVTDTSAATRSAPTGSVGLGSDGAGGFADECVLFPSGPIEARCQAVYEPTAVGDGSHQITASYGGDVAHRPSQGTAAVAVNGPNGGSDTETELTCDPPTVFLGGASVCTVDVQDLGPAPTTPTGQIAFASTNAGSFDPAGCTLFSIANGRARCQVLYTAGTTGNHKVTALYPGDAGHEPSIGTSQLTVVPPNNGHRTTTALQCQPTSVSLGETTTCIATVTDINASPTTPRRAVVFASDSPGTFNAGGCVLAAAGAGKATCTITYTASQVGSGSHKLTAVYEGDPTHEPSLGETRVTVNNAANAHQTATTLTCQPNPVESGDPTNCTVTVRDIAAGTKAAPTGRVTFATNGAGAFAAPECNLGQTGLDIAACQVTYTPTGPAAIQELEATYNPNDADHAGSSDSFDLQVLAQAPDENQTSTTLTCQPNPVESGDPTSCTARVKDIAARTKAAPTGKVAFTAIGAGAFVPTAECTLAPIAGPNGDSSSCQLNYTPTGPAAVQQLEATYESDDADHAGSSDTFDLQVLADGGGGGNQRATSTTLTCQPNPVESGDPTNCTATVRDITAGTKAAPSGKVAFDSDGLGAFGAPECTLAPTGADRAACQLNYTPTGPAAIQQLEAGYGPDDTDHTGSSDTFDLQVLADGGGDGEDPNTTSTSLECAPAGIILGSGSVCTATISDTAAAGQSVPTGSVEFDSDGAGDFPIDCNLAPAGVGQAQARCQTIYEPTAVGDGSHQITASYEGDADHEPSDDSAVVTVGAPEGDHATATAIVCRPDTVILGGVSICTVNVKDLAATPTTPGGGVLFASDQAGEFSSGGCLLFAVAPGEARCQLIYKPSQAGRHEVTAIYPGDAGHQLSENSELLDVVDPPTERHDTTTALDCAPVNVTLGNAAICTATVTDTDADPTAPTRAVVFTSDGPGNFNVGGCQLGQAVAGTASCQITYTPSAVGAGTHRISAAYEGDNSHEPSRLTSDDLTVNAPVVPPPPAPVHQTATTLACAPASVLNGTATTCTVTIADTNAAPTTPAGTVNLASDGQGAFSANGGCALAGAGAGKASCQVTYTPIAVGSGNHRIAATYAGNADHLQSQGAAQLQVTAAIAPALAPNTILRKKPRKKTAKRKTMFKFIADQPGARFQCKLDKKPFKPCRSPWKKKVKAGRHTFQVRAINAQGIADPTPAVFKWKVGKASRPKR